MPASTASLLLHTAKTQKPPQQVFALIAQVFIPEIAQLLKQYQPLNEHLAVGAPDDLTRHLPFLVMLTENHPFTETLNAHPGSENVIYGLTTAKFASLKNHFRQLEKVTIGDETVQLRYYDPAIMALLLEHHDITQQPLFFGPIQYWQIGGQQFQPQENTNQVVPVPPLKLNSEQQAGLTHHREETFIRAHIADLAQSLAINPSTIEPQVREGIAKARGYGLSSRHALKQFSALWASGLTDAVIDTLPGIKSILLLNNLPDWQKCDKLIRALQ